MYRRPHFLEELHAIREEMSRECDYDLDLFAEMVRSNRPPRHGPARNIRGERKYAPAREVKADSEKAAGENPEPGSNPGTGGDMGASGRGRRRKKRDISGKEERGGTDE